MCLNGKVLRFEVGYEELVNIVFVAGDGGDIDERFVELEEGRAGARGAQAVWQLYGLLWFEGSYCAGPVCENKQ